MSVVCKAIYSKYDRSLELIEVFKSAFASNFLVVFIHGSSAANSLLQHLLVCFDETLGNVFFCINFFHASVNISASENIRSCD
jgi:hypothetical protein